MSGTRLTEDWWLSMDFLKNVFLFFTLTYGSGYGRMLKMKKLKYWILIGTTLVKTFTPTILWWGSSYLFRDTVMGDVCLILGIVSLGWVTDIKFPEKPE